MQEYKIFIGGVEHTVLLDDEDAKRQGLKPPTKAAERPVNKARAPKNKALDDE